MKVLHIINSLNYGGAENLVRQMLPKFNEEGIRADILLLNSKETPYKEWLMDEGIKVINSSYGLYSLRNIFMIRKIMKNYDLIHVHLFPAQYFVALANLFSVKKNTIVTTEHSTHNRRRDKKILQIVEFIIYNQFAKVICISENSKENLINWLPKINKDKLITIENGVDLNVFKKAKGYRRDQFIPDYETGDKILLMVARLTEPKDHVTLINAMSYLPDDYKLIIVGEGPLENKIKDKIYEKNLNEKVIMLGHRNDVPNIMKTCDLYIQSSRWEGFGLVVVEAMASGKISLGSNVPGLNSVIGNEKLLFEFGNSQELSQCIVNTLEDNNVKEKLENYCRDRADEFSIDKMIKGYVHTYKEVSNEKTKSR